MVEKVGEVTVDNIVREGYLFKQSKYMKEWRKRWFVLTKTHLLSFKEFKKYTKPTETIELSICKTVKSVEEEINKKNSFRLDAKGRMFYLQAENYSEKEAWIGALGKAMVKPSVMKDDSEDEYMNDI